MADRVIRMGSGTIVDVHANARKISPEELSW
jgi:hypothetical protein